MAEFTTGSTRGALVALAAGLLLGGCASTGSSTTVATRDAPGPTIGATSATTVAAPVLDAVTFHTQLERYQTVYPEFHFHDASGTVRYIHRELIGTNDPGLNAINTDGIIRIAADLQRQGTVFVGSWPCGPGSYYVTIRAFLVNLEGGKSNTLQYTIHCNGG
jgi:hypothetical protein